MPLMNVASVTCARPAATDGEPPFETAATLSVVSNMGT
jgi:hypothetical protein